MSQLWDARVCFDVCRCKWVLSIMANSNSTIKPQSRTSLLSAVLLCSQSWLDLNSIYFCIAALYSLWMNRLISEQRDGHLWNRLVALTWDHMITLETPRLFASSSWQIVSLSNRDSASNCSCRFSHSCYFLADLILSLACLLSQLVMKLKLNYLK